MHIEKISITKENRFGDRYTIERDQLVYDDEAERQKGMVYNRYCHSDNKSYSEHCRKAMDSTIHASTSQIFDSIKEYFDMMDNLN